MFDKIAGQENAKNILESMITSDNIPIEEVIIFSLTGARIKTIGYLSGKRVSVPVGDLSPGVYISRVRTKGGETIIQKLIKQ